MFTLEQHYYWMEKALLVAQKSLPEDVPVGALIVDKENNCVAEGFNTREKDHNVVGHAEINCLKNAAKAINDWRMKGFTMYVTLEPCPMCFQAIYQSRLSKVVFGAFDAEKVNNAANTNCVSLDIVGGILEDKCKNSLKAFFENLRKGSLAS
ncbi:MAG TPA: nucleoside deaminase [Vampirovibrionales bacterium]